MDQINLAVAFLGGIFSIFSPCILPVLPSFLAYITGVSLEEIASKSKQNNLKINLQLILNTAFFVLGFSLIFLLFGAVIGGLGKFLVINQIALMQLGGLVIIILALHQLEIIKIKFLLNEVKLQDKTTHKFKGWLRSF
jgi:cytochrome c-type biogenesis protein